MQEMRDNWLAWIIDSSDEENKTIVVGEVLRENNRNEPYVLH
jgi:hypothetical protein